MFDTEDIKETFQKLIDDTASEEERRALQRSVIDGRIVVVAEDDSAAGGAATPGAADFDITVVDEERTRVALSPATHEVLRGKIFTPPPGLLPPQPPLTFLGRAEASHKVKELLGMTPDDGLNSHAVVDGWPGVGKTTLVGTLAYDHEVAAALPDGVLWAALNQKPDLLSIIAGWGRALGTEELLKAGTLAEATAGLRRLLAEKRMLLIVDDVWDAGHAAPFLQARGRLCSILVTTRLPDVAAALSSSGVKSYTLPVLSANDSLELLRVFAPATVSQHPAECRELADALGYLPLALHVAGRLLKSEERLGWGVADLLRELSTETRVIEEKAPPDMAVDGMTPTVEALLRKSTSLLDEETRDCFAALGAFPEKPVTFDLDAMNAVWQIPDPRRMARRLVGRGLLEPVGNGRFQMHALLVMHAQSLCEDYTEFSG